MNNSTLRLSSSMQKKLLQNPHQNLDRGIKEYASQIKESNSKIDEYINKIDQRVSIIISGRLNKFVVMHSQIMSEKNSQIRHLEQIFQRNRMSCLSQNLQKLEMTIRNYQDQIQRVTNIKEMFRKQSEKYKIDMQIIEKQLQVTRARQKKLIKRIWILQQDIKDIYNSQMAANQQLSTHFQQNKHWKNNKKIKTFKMTTKTKIYHTQPDESIQSFRINFQDKYLPNKTNKVKTQLKKHISDSIEQQARLTTNTFKSINSFHRITDIRSMASSRLKYNLKQKRQKYDIYEDLRVNLRKANRNRQLEPKYVEEQQRLIKKQDFDLICLHGSKIMTQIQKVMIDNYGQLKQVDQYSIELLTMLFRNEHAMKILEIVLFNYSIAAIDQLKNNATSLKNEKSYAQPIVQVQEQPIKLQKMHPLRQQAKHSIKRKVKHKFDHINNFFSQRIKK